MYEIEFSPSALEDLKSLRKSEQKKVVERIETQLQHEPTVQTRNRKRLRPNDVAEWELRVDGFRVFYNVVETKIMVTIEAIGIKIGNVLFIRGESRQL